MNFDAYNIYLCGTSCTAWPLGLIMRRRYSLIGGACRNLCILLLWWRAEGMSNHYKHWALTNVTFSCITSFVDEGVGWISAVFICSNCSFDWARCGCLMTVSCLKVFFQQLDHTGSLLGDWVVPGICNNLVDGDLSCRWVIANGFRERNEKLCVEPRRLYFI